MGPLSRPVRERTWRMDDQGIARHAYPYGRTVAQVRWKKSPAAPFCLGYPGRHPSGQPTIPPAVPVRNIHPSVEYLVMNLTDKVIVITGAASGMGEACAHLFAQEGAKVVLADRDQIRG